MLNKKQTEFFEEAMRGTNIFLTGVAGTGKSYLTKEIIKAFEQKNKNIVVCATTGVAARAIGGSTVHHQFHIDVTTDKVREKKNINDWLKITDLLIIDEISMLSFHLFNTITNEIKAYNPDCQLIVIGDFFQLPPIVTKETQAILRSRGYKVKSSKCHCFHAKNWRTLNFKVCELTEPMRQQDADFAKALQDLKNGCLDKQDKDFLRVAQTHSYFNNDEAVTLTCTNKAANEINNDKLTQLKGAPKVYEATYWGLYDKEISKKLFLKKGAKVILTTNKDKSYCNGDIGWVEELNSDCISVKLLNGEIIEVEPYEFNTYVVENEDGALKTKLVGSIKQFPVKLAWAMTVHKSQGQTFESVNFLYDEGMFKGCEENLTLLYVGISRVKSIEKLYLRFKSTLPQFVNDDIVEFYQGNYETYYRDWDKNNEIFGF